jgi:decaprenylphospho-beta-D-erythro-pentofuranosid-2-ulose 2-reductase
MMNAVGQTDTIVVLGGASDIGVAVADRLGEIGTRRIILAGPNQGSLEAAASRLTNAADDVVTVGFDATQTETHEAFFASLTDEYGDLDVVIVAFGVLPDQENAEADPSIAVHTAQVNYVGALSSLLIAGRLLANQGHGTVVVLSSVAGQRPRRSNFIYGSTKAGIDAAAEGLGYALEGTGAHVVTVRPGFVTSKMTEGLDEAPMSATPEQVADATVQAIMKHQAVVWVPAQLRFVLSGIRHLPRVAMKRVKA